MKSDEADGTNSYLSAIPKSCTYREKSTRCQMQKKEEHTQDTRSHDRIFHEDSKSQIAADIKDKLEHQTDFRMTISVRVLDETPGTFQFKWVYTGTPWKAVTSE